MKKYLIINRGFLGDILFSTSVATRLKKDGLASRVYYAINFIQPMDLLNNHNDIDGVFLLSSNNGTQSCQEFIDRELANDNLVIVEMPPVRQNEPATIQYQRAAGTRTTQLSFDIETIPFWDKKANEVLLKSLINPTTPRRRIIGWQMNWEWKAYQCTKELLEKGIGAPHRNITAIIEDLSQDCLMVPLGFDRNVSQYDKEAFNPESYNLTASLIKKCDWVIGSEGGITNLAAAVGTKTIITTDFIMQNYGPNGRVSQNLFPQMGPSIYYPNAGHRTLDECIPDNDIAKAIREIINV